jgi:DNA-binding transcriptional ArsR family regulator
MMLRCGLLESKRCGKWTYYRRNEKTIQELARYIGTEL